MGSSMSVEVARRLSTAGRAYVAHLRQAVGALESVAPPGNGAGHSVRAVTDAIVGLRNALDGAVAVQAELGGTGVPAGSVRQANWALRTLMGTAGAYPTPARQLAGRAAAGDLSSARRLGEQIHEATGLTRLATRTAEDALAPDRLRLHRLPAGLDGTPAPPPASSAGGDHSVALLPDVDEFDGTRFLRGAGNRDEYSGEPLGDMIGWSNGSSGGSFDVPGEFLG